MNLSHLSSRHNYDTSCEHLNELTQLARESGAYGSRLTGAGWGGCCVSLIKKDMLSSFIEKMKGYYTRERESGQEIP